MPDDDLNPYAPPREPDALDRKLLVSVWREGPLVVAHRDAEWPRFCVHTGAPATGAYEYDALFARTGRLGRSVKLWIPVCDRCLTDHRRLRAQTLLGGGLLAISAAVFFAVPKLPGREVTSVLVLVATCTVGLAIWFHAHWVYGKSLVPLRAEGDYVWLRGAHADFLQRLPDWPP